jgi:hypothetical protein
MINDHEMKQLDGLLNIFNKKTTKQYINDPKLVGKRRVFNKKLLEIFDIPARNIIKAKLENFVDDNPNELEQDLIITEKTFKYKFIEIQVVSQWIEKKYPYENLYLYERKAKYGNDTLFITLNRQMTIACIFDRQSINNKKPRRLCKYSKEFVYDVPWHRVITIDIDALNIDLIKCY